MARAIESLESRLERLVDRSGDCWPWVGPTDKNGYGRISLGRANPDLKAHRIVWERERGSIPEGLCVLHRCDNPPCVRVDHLFLGTQGDNVRDAQAKGRLRGQFRKGEQHRQAKLTNAQRDLIVYRRTQGDSARAIAVEFGIHPKYVSRVQSLT